MLVLAQDQSDLLRELICEAFDTLVELHPGVVVPYIDNLFQLMLHMTEHDRSIKVGTPSPIVS